MVRVRLMAELLDELNTIINRGVADVPHVGEDPQDSATILNGHVGGDAWMLGQCC